MKKLMFWSYHHPKLVLILLLGVTLIFSFFIPKIPVDVSVQMFWMEGDPAKQHGEGTMVGSAKSRTPAVRI